ncbi:alpha/beta hydrolase [Carbonactinospora thermoautotrophica]|uniref:alpha/beta hydrolase n=1 Tax=Carbonactinospora thermoautotrophica TaxID=1469144 RepID=UPI003DA97DCE
MVSLPELRDAQPEAFSAAADAWRALAEQVRARSDELGKHSRSLSGAWEGPAHRAATAQLDRVGGDLRAGADRMLEAARVLADHAARVAEAKSMLQRALQAAAGTPLRIGDDGSVSWPPMPATGNPADLQARAEEIARGIQAALQLANAADQEASARLAAVVPAAMLAGPGGLVPPDQIPPKGTDPKKVKQWWDSLTPEQQRYVIDHYPGLIGSLDGIPCVVRDEANRAVLAREKQRIEDRIRQLQAKGGRSDAENRELADLKDKLNGINAIEKRLHETAPDKKRGHAIVALGNPDEADNIVTSVPGTGSRLGTIGGDLHRADKLVDAAESVDSSKKTAAIVWYGYDAPQEVFSPGLKWPPVLSGDATDPKFALNARDALDRFQDGLRVTHEGPRSHNTVIGHSYGSTVVGFTARDKGLDVDDVIFVGSPGVGVDHARDLGIDPDHVWSSTAKNDPIQYSPSLDPRDIGDGQDDLIHGANPSKPEFGGRVFESAPGDPMTQWEKNDWGIPVPQFSAKAHSQYWDDNSPSLMKMGEIIAGKAR